jgi:hypothetical protein
LLTLVTCHDTTPVNLKVTIARWLSDQPQPGWVEVRFSDTSGREWTLEDKPPIFSARSFVATDLPIEGVVQCTVRALRLDSQARDVATVQASVDAPDGTSTFDVFREQLEGPPSPEESRVLDRYGWLSQFDRDTLRLASKVAREHDPAINERGAEPIFADDFPVAIEASGGQQPSSVRMTWLKLARKLPPERGRVAGKPFWLRSDIQRWVSRGRSA